MVLCGTRRPLAVIARTGHEPTHQRYERRSSEFRDAGEDVVPPTAIFSAKRHARIEPVCRDVWLTQEGSTELVAGYRVPTRRAAGRLLVSSISAPRPASPPGLGLPWTAAVQPARARLLRTAGLPHPPLHRLPQPRRTARFSPGAPRLGTGRLILYLDRDSTGADLLVRPDTDSRPRSGDRLRQRPAHPRGRAGLKVEPGRAVCNDRRVVVWCRHMCRTPVVRDVERGQAEAGSGSCGQLRTLAPSTAACSVKRWAGSAGS